MNIARFNEADKMYDYKAFALMFHNLFLDNQNFNDDESFKRWLVDTTAENAFDLDNDKNSVLRKVPNVCPFHQVKNILKLIFEVLNPHNF